MVTTQADVVVSLFSGAGGFSYGFTEAGLKPAFGVEIDADACGTYETNVGSECLQADLAEIAVPFLRDRLDGREPLAIIGGPPCQGFSTAGARRADDPRNRLIFNYLRIVAGIRPRWFIFENVEGLLTSGNGEAVTGLLREFLKIGYSVRLQKVNFAAYGVPQTRKRVLIIGNRLGFDFAFPEETHSYESGKSKKFSAKPLAPSLETALAGLGKASTQRSSRVAYATELPVNQYDAKMREGNESGTVSIHYYSPGDEVRLAHLKPGQTMKDLPEEFWHESFRQRAFRRVSDGMPTEKRGGAPAGIKRLRGDLNCLTITGAASREFIHTVDNRPLTLRECARIQTFPDRYEFVGNSASIGQQIGNAVPPQAAAAFARHLLALDGAFGGDLTRPPGSASARFFGYVLTEAAAMSPALQRTNQLLSQLVQEELV